MTRTDTTKEKIDGLEAHMTFMLNMHDGGFQLLANESGQVLHRTESSYQHFYIAHRRGIIRKLEACTSSSLSSSSSKINALPSCHMPHFARWRDKQAHGHHVGLLAYGSDARALLLHQLLVKGR